MTEVSYLWNGTTIGDASEAPYFAHHLNNYLYLPQLAGDTDHAYVVPGYLNDLHVSYVAAGVWGVNVASGAALVNGFLYHNDDNVGLAIDPPLTAYGRYDLVVLRYDRTAQKIRLAIVKGAEAPDSSTARVIPELTQDALIWEIPLAMLLISGIGVYSAWDYVFFGGVYDKRRFLPPRPSADLAINENLIHNSEYMALSNYFGGPEGWYGVVSTLTDVDYFPQMSRGRSLYCEASVGTYAFLRRDVRTYTLKGLIAVPAVHSAYTLLRISAIRAGGAFTTFHELHIEANDYRDSSAYEFCETFTLPDSIQNVTGLQIVFISSGGITVIGQCILVPGYHPGPFRQFHETLPFRAAVQDAAWNNTAKSSGTTTIDLSASFLGALAAPAILHGVKGIMVRLMGRDSGSAATPTCTMAVQGYAAPYNTNYLTLEVGGIANDTYREQFGILPVNQPAFAAHLTAPQFRIVIVASGAGTFDATLEIIGIVT